jgi:hypothetical protein
MINAFSDHEKKTAVFISSSLPHSIADFYTNLEKLNDLGIHTRYVDRARRFIITDNIFVYFKIAGNSLSGLWCDEMFGDVSQFDLYRLKDSSKPRFSGTLVEYIKKIEDNAKTDAFLNSELEKLRGGVIV